MKNSITFLIFMLVFMSGMVLAQPQVNPGKLVLELEWDPEENVEVIVAEGLMFKSVDMLKKFLDKKPSGTTVVWDPGCVRIGTSPILSSAKEIRELKIYLEKRGIKLVLSNSS